MKKRILTCLAVFTAFLLIVSCSTPTAPAATYSKDDMIGSWIGVTGDSDGSSYVYSMDVTKNVISLKVTQNGDSAKFELIFSPWDINSSTVTGTLFGETSKIGTLSGNGFYLDCNAQSMHSLTLSKK